jgi:prolyl-tRNA synthetase
MRLSQLFFQTQRTVSSDSRLPGHQLLLKAGLIRSLSPRYYSFLPLGLRVRQKIEGIARQKIAALGGQEVSLPMLYRAGLAPDAAGDRPEGQAGSPLASSQRGGLQQSGDDTILATVRGAIRSYRQLPMLLYEVSQSLSEGDEKAGGLFGACEARWFQAYSLHTGFAGLVDFYAHMRETLIGVLRYCGVEAIVAAGREDDSGAITGHKILFLSQSGGERIIRCPSCGYAASQAVARASRKSPAIEEMLPTQDVETPDCRTITNLAAYLGIPKSRTAKAIFVVAHITGEGDRLALVVVRGDTDLNESRLRCILNAMAVGPATEAEIRATGAEPGYGSPIGLEGITIIVDELVTRSPNLVAGANRSGYHTLNVNYGRDYGAAIVSDIALVEAGDACPACGSPLTLERAVELADMAMIGDTFSRPAGVTYVDSVGQIRPVVTGRYSLYTDRILAATAESHFDDFGLVWPTPIAPCHVYLMTAGKTTPEVTATADKLYADLLRAGIDVLYDDRDERAGVKFNDADLLGIPLRVSVGERGLRSGIVELKQRGGGPMESLPIESLVPHVTELT